MGLDRLVWVNRLVGEGDFNIAVAGDDLGDVGWQAVHDGVGDKDSSEVVRRVMQGLSIGGLLEPVWVRAALSMVRSELSLIARISLGNRRWNNTGDGGRQMHS